MEIKECIAKNLADLRKINKLTQSEVANKLNYSDKAISKWEHGEALPDIEVLVEICKLYNVTLNDIIKDDLGNVAVNAKKEVKEFTTNKIVITMLAVSLVFFIATFVYVALKLLPIAPTENTQNCYPVFVWAIPISCILLIIFNGLWGKKILTFVIVSVLVWSLLAAIYVQFIYIDTKFANLWPIFILGTPSQIAIILWSRLKKRA